ncbi:HAD family hydrolase [Chloroflexota bacterium]
MKETTVIFDLFGTLVSNFSTEGYYDALTRMAEALELTPDDFKQAWFSTLKERNIGPSQSCTTDVECICRELKKTPSENQIQLAVQARLDYIRYVMTPQLHAVETLLLLKECGYKTGLLSNCSHEIPIIWPETQFAPLMDTTVFSCQVNMKKPDQRIYRLITERLGVRSDECLFVGDGGSHELSAALEIGMHPVLYRPDADSTEQHLKNREEWEGPEITSLADVMSVLSGG